MSEPLPRLRMNLDFMPSPIEDRPGLLIRDSFGYSNAALVVPPPLVELLAFFDGAASLLDVKQELYRRTNDLESGAVAEHLHQALHEAGFLENEIYFGLRDARQQTFRDSPVREPAHSGSGYPDDIAELRPAMSSWLAADGAEPPAGLCGIAAPHVSPSGGHPCYASAYRLLGPHLRDKTFIVLGTSHYGEPDKFGLTRKPYVTPYGPAATALDLVDRLERAAPGAVLMEDYCHAVEHSIEFQVLFLQSVVGPDVKVLPILCGSFARSIYEGGKPEDNEDVRRFLDTLGELNAARNDLFWILGVDMAHIGARYGDREPATANEGYLEEVGARDLLRISAISAGLRDNYWGRVQEGQDEIRWCGSAPFYSFLYAAPQARGTLERYEQWNIDPHSVVTFAGMSFHP